MHVIEYKRMTNLKQATNYALRKSVAMLLKLNFKLWTTSTTNTPVTFLAYISVSQQSIVCSLLKIYITHPLHKMN